MKVEFSFVSSDILASFTFDVSLLPILAIGVLIVVKIVVNVRKKYIRF